MNPTLSPSEIALTKTVADLFDARLKIRSRCEAFARQAYDASFEDACALQIDDVSGIPFLMDIVGIDFYQLRAFVRAREGDVVAAICPAMPEYQDYNRDMLGFGTSAFVEAAPVTSRIEVGLACSQGEAFERLVALARERGRLLIHPYMGVEAVWALAAKLADAAGVEVRVLAPPPPVTWFANDKIHLDAVATALLGRDATMPSHIGTDAETLALRLVQLAHTREVVALKMARCASAMGNRLFKASEVLSMNFETLVGHVRAFLKDKEWEEGDPVHVVEWANTTCSPSTQLWIPPMGAGAPRLDGIYEQLLEGEEGCFLGSVPSALPKAVEAELARASMLVAHVYQALGYVGRCSFDFIVADGVADVRFVECNGRWGGTSTPMHLLDRLFPGGRPPYRARDYIAPELIGQPFSRLLELLGEALYDHRTKKGRFIVYNVGGFSSFGKFDVIALGESMDDATRALETDLAKLLIT